MVLNSRSDKFIQGEVKYMERRGRYDACATIFW